MCSLPLRLKPSTEPLEVLYIASFLVFAGSQVVYMVPSKTLCEVGRYPCCLDSCLLAWAGIKPCTGRVVHCNDTGDRLIGLGFPRLDEDHRMCVFPLSRLSRTSALILMCTQHRGTRTTYRSRSKATPLLYRAIVLLFARYEFVFVAVVCCAVSFLHRVSLITNAIATKK